MLLRGSIAAVAFALSAFSGSPGARADEAYVCEAGRVVYVKMGELESLKHSDPCIASYYGIKLPAVTPAPAPNSATAPAANEAPAVEFKTLETPENQASNASSANLKIASADTAVPRHRTPPVAAPGTDFRNVRLINAGPDSDGWYRHDR